MAVFISPRIVAIFALFCASAAVADTHKYTSPTAGVTCDSWKRTTSPTGGQAIRPVYWGRCLGNPIGIARGYQYRQLLTCPGWGTVPFNGPWKSGGGEWSITSCPDGAEGTNWSIQFQFL